jgi:ubiquinone/menaquinone biosynthesis C-methylase UbiE
MVMSLGKHFATEKRTLAYCVSTYPETKTYANRLIRTINKYFNINVNCEILEIGSAQGKLVGAIRSLGYSCQGIEPNESAIDVSKELSSIMNIDIKVQKGFAENIPFNGNNFDLVLADSVMEHVIDLSKALNEVSRVLKPHGAFYFSTASCLCPRQDEIRFFPFFPWYPQKVKIMLMRWAVQNKPSLVGYTETPAIHWFTPWKTKQMLRELGFIKIYDRWDLIDSSSYVFYKKVFIKIIKTNKLTKLLGDILVPACGYLAIMGA